jgi:hypothetical protein
MIQEQDPVSSEQGNTRAFEAVRVYIAYKLHNQLYNAYNECTSCLCLCFGLYLFESGREVTGARGRCGPAAAGRAGPFDRKEHSFFPSHFGPSGLRSFGKI